MKKTLVVACVASLVVEALAVPGEAARKKKKPKPVTFYLHGTEQLGEVELQENWLNNNPMRMDQEKPQGPGKSRFTTNYVVGPNEECSGNGLYPLWYGDLKGKVKGPIKITLFTAATPAAELALELFPDATGGCNSDAAGTMDYVPPAASTTVSVPPGPGEVVATIKKANFKVGARLALQVRVAEQGPMNPDQVRLFYDSEESPASVKLNVLR